MRKLDVLAKVRRKTNIYTAPRFDSANIEAVLEPGADVHITGLHRYSTHTFYSIRGGSFIYSGDVQVLRDMEFYYTNFKSTNLAKNQHFENGIASIQSGDSVGPFSTMYDSLQLFALNLGGLTSGGGFGGGIIGTSKRGSSDSSILGSFGLSSNTSITGALGGFGVDTSSFSKYLGGVTVGSLFDGSFYR